jgi:hypothetical protein
LANQIDQLLEVAEACLHTFLVQVADEDLDLTLMVGDEGLDVVGVEEFCALRLGEDEVGEGEEADPTVEGEPADDEDGP